jgi:cathepsin L
VPLKFTGVGNETLDWQLAGAVTAVKDQHLDQHYGTCWSFATSGTMEGQEFLASKRQPVNLSPQMLVDCCPQCAGHPDVSLNWLLSVGGQDTEDSYGPYQGKVGKCNNISATVGQKISQVYAVDEGEEHFMNMLQHGPMHVAIDCTSIKNYEGGVLTKTTCLDPGNHDVLLVGAGEEDGVKYWRIKNSWGDWWGEAGYFRVARNEGQLCLGKVNSFGSAATMVAGVPTPLDVVV